MSLVLAVKKVWGSETLPLKYAFWRKIYVEEKYMDTVATY